ncbi:nucleoside triphosphate pyrophosphohydrolase [sulfur-oxidizing endosymbiont of Gigantopelta aegis]|uniref:nucleoside triphosphate pyrophosphohydrolase n=1 Tax=sulfur-oxidizing endosymbiont of Gigantopelta aegis TaxID=2794934 RepID=UPI0018DE20CC|nr:nucleoside triphosphate pyrophosphohydrolase [sulfur-oxidizing endosymbiont of Gigantopelta aegis]
MQQLTRLLEIMTKLRDPQNGCPWDLKQDYQSLVSYTLEEAYEVAEAIELGDMNELKKELGDLLFQVVFYAQLAKEEGVFEFEDIAQAISDKMIMRHPHVFAGHHYEDEAAFLKAWEEQKELEKQQAQTDTSLASETAQPISLMAGISKNLPAMTRAVKIQKKAAQIEFDWECAEELLPVIKDELDELSAEMDQAKQVENSEQSVQCIEEELGDVLFSCVNLARKLDIDPEKALRMSNHKFSQRFKAMEAHFQYDRQSMEQATMKELDAVWAIIKKNLADKEKSRD